MNIGKILNLIAENDINPNDVFSLVEKIKSTDLSDESNLRDIIQEAGKIAKKPIDRQKEDAIVKKIKSEGVNEDIFNML